MKTIKAIMLIAIMAMVPMAVKASDHMLTESPRDTVVIELENGSRIIIYTRDRSELKKLQAYDINAMVRDLNASIGDDNIDYLEIENKDGSKYLIQSPTVIVGEGESSGDTVVIGKDSMRKVHIRLGGLEVTSGGDDDEDSDEDPSVDVKKYTYAKKSKRGTRNYFNVDLGINNWLENGSFPSNNNSAYAVKPWGSWYVGFNWINRTRVAGPLYIDWGGGVSWYNFKLENTGYQFVKGENEVELVERLDVDGTKSKISAAYVNASFVPMLDFGSGSKRVRTVNSDGFTFRSTSSNGFRIGAGPYVGYRLASRSKFVFEEGGSRERNKVNDHFFLENFRYGIRGQLGFQSFDMFVMYDLNEVFVKDRGPNGARLNAFTVGIIL